MSLDTATLAMMYQTDDTPDITVPRTLDRRTRKIKVGAIEYEVPTTEYVQQLEQTVQQYGQTIVRQQRMLDQINRTLTRTHHSQRSQNIMIDNIRREMIRKEPDDYN